MPSPIEVHVLIGWVQLRVTTLADPARSSRVTRRKRKIASSGLRLGPQWAGLGGHTSTSSRELSARNSRERTNAQEARLGLRALTTGSGTAPTDEIPERQTYAGSSQRYAVAAQQQGP